MTYPDLFKSRYPELKGSLWLKSIDSEDLKAFISIGLQEADHGKLGGKALVKKRGKKWMQEIGRRGALMTNIKKMIKKGIENESRN